MKEKWLILLLMLVKFLLPFLLPNPVFELHRDEYLYYEQGRHLAFGYLENPPLIGVLAYLSSLFGGAAFWIKFWPALFGAATLWLVTKLAKEFGGGLYAQFIAALGVLFSAYLRIHFLFQPNFLDVFFWTLSAYFLARYINTKAEKFIFLLALSLVAGWYSKYSVLFFVLSLLLSLLLTQHRTIFLRKGFWMALCFGALLIIPNLLWQYYHNWPLVHHMQELRETQLQHLNRTDFIKEQILMLFPVLFVWIGGLVWTLRNKIYRVVGYTYLLVVVLLMMGSGKGYYALGAYPMLLAAGGVWAERVSARKPSLRYAFASLILLLSLPFVPVLLPLHQPTEMAAFNKKWSLEKMGILNWEDGKSHPLQQDFADMIGWRELTEKTERLYDQQSDSVKSSTLIFCGNYGLAGALKYYAKGESFRNKIISENGTFLLWAPDKLSFTHLIYIDEELPDKDDTVLRHFAGMRVIDSCTNPYSRQYGAKIVYFQTATDSARIIATQDWQQAKARFGQ